MTATGSAEDVGRLFDMINDRLAEALGGAIQVGYWDGPTGRAPIAEASARLTDLVIDRLEVGSGDRVRDVGCGNGIPALRLAGRHAHVTGISISDHQIGPAGGRFVLQVPSVSMRSRP